MRTVGIIGGGISGTLVVLNLLKHSAKPIHIIWFDTDNRFCKGLAYSTLNDRHLLNTRAAAMSAFPAEPNHFVNWLQANETGYTANQFVPRKIYAAYITDTYQRLTEANPKVQITQKAEEVKALHVSGDRYFVVAKNTNEVEALVLAPGNFLPAHPRSPDSEFISSPTYFRNAFDPLFAASATTAESVTLIGAGLTMVDALTTLDGAAYKGTITVISPHGYLPMPNSEESTSAAPASFLEAGTRYTLSEVFGLLKARLKQAIQNKEQPQPLIDSMRPHLQELWLHFSFGEKKRFLRHLRHKWGVARHRVPPASMNLLKKYLEEQRLTILKGRIEAITTVPKGFLISYSTSVSRQNTFSSELIVNCTGPEPDFAKTGSLLFKQLINSGLITPHELGYGLKAPKNGQLGQRFFTLGPPLKGVLWESTAVPEIRLQAQEIASKIILD